MSNTLRGSPQRTFLRSACMWERHTFHGDPRYLALGTNEYAEIIAEECNKCDLRFKISAFERQVAYGSQVVGFLDQLAGFSAIIFFPYCYVSILFLELYAMEMPMIFPSLDCLVRMDSDDVGIMKRRGHYETTCPVVRAS